MVVMAGAACSIARIPLGSCRRRSATTPCGVQSKGRETSVPAVPPFLRALKVISGSASRSCCLHGGHPSAPTCQLWLSSAGCSRMRSAVIHQCRASTNSGSLGRSHRVLFPIDAGFIFGCVGAICGDGARRLRPLAHGTDHTPERPFGRAGYALRAELWRRWFERRTNHENFSGATMTFAHERT